MLITPPRSTRSDEIFQSPSGIARTWRQGKSWSRFWFAGVHSNVGGWYENRDLSSIALVWMIEKAKAAGMKIDASKLAGIKAQRNPVGKIHESYEKFWKFRGQ